MVQISIPETPIGSIPQNIASGINVYAIVPHAIAGYNSPLRPICWPVLRSTQLFYWLDVTNYFILAHVISFAKNK